MAQPGVPKRPATVALIAVAYFVTGKLGLKLAFVHASSTAVWPPTGIALAAFLLMGYQVWPGVLLGAFLVNLTTAGSVATSLGIALGNTLEGILGAYFVNRLAHGRRAFDRGRDVFTFAVLAGLLSTAVSATLGVTSLALGGYASWMQYRSIWLTWWLGDAAGALVLAPFLVLWMTGGPVTWSRKRTLEAVGLFGALLLVGEAVFRGIIPPALAFLCIPLLVWAAFRFGQREAVSAVAVLSAIAIWGTLHGRGPFALATPNQSLLLLQAFLGTMSVMSLAIAALVSERKQAEEALRQASSKLEMEVRERSDDLERAVDVLLADVAERKRIEQEMDRFFDVSPDLFCIADFAGCLKHLNPAWEGVLGFTKEELMARPYLHFVHPDDRAATLTAAQTMMETGTAIVSFENRWLVKGGSYRWLLWNVTPDLNQRLTYAAARDITERKQMEQELRENEERFRLLVAGVKDYAIYALDNEGHLLSWNDGAASITGYQAEDIVGKHFSVFFLPEDVACGKPEQILKGANEKGRRADEGWRVRKNGSRFWADTVLTVLRNRDGSPRGFTEVTRDITERKRAEELERRTTEIAALSQMGSLLHTCFKAQEAYQIIAEFGPKLFPWASGALFMLNDAKNLVEQASAWGASDLGEAVFAPEDCWALRAGRVHQVDHPESAVVCPHVAGSHGASSLCLPLVAQGDALGVIYLRSEARAAQAPDQYRGLADTQRQLATAVAEQAALALANVKLRETLRMQSIRDPLTALYNRRYMEDSLERELSRSARNGTSIGTIMLDLDHFKGYNDTFGHEAGDTLLRELGSFLRSHLREGDIPCRFGGEEFFLILPDASREVTQHRAERLREEIKRLNVQYCGRSLRTVTLSLGVAVFPEHGATAGAIFRAADLALYRAKTQGRDQVVVAQATDSHPEEEDSATTFQKHPPLKTSSSR